MIPKSPSPSGPATRWAACGYSGPTRARVPTGRAEHMKAFDLLPFRSYESRNHRPVRLLIRKLDRQQRIVSGTFEGQLYSQTDSLAVSDGHFDVKY